MPVVGIGASSQRLHDLQELLAALSGDLGAAYVVVFAGGAEGVPDSANDSLLAHLAARTSLPVALAEDGARLAPGTLAVVPPGTLAYVEGDVVRLRRPEPEAPALPIDTLLRSLVPRAPAAAGLLLAGTHGDGDAGARELQGAGGLVLAQPDDSVDRRELPPALGRHVDGTLAPGDMPAALRRHLKLLAGRGAAPPLAEVEPEALARVLDLLRDGVGHEFRHYKQPTLDRRIRRRMALRRSETLAAYADTLAADPAELSALFHDLLINVTRFFRRPEAWSELGRRLGALAATRRVDEPLRVWVPGCSTGEEAYTAAIVALEALQEQGRPPRLQLFGTDIAPAAIAAARAGLYPASIAQDVSRERLTRFFHRQGEHYRVDKALREPVVFALQDVVSDPPFSELDVVSCRNLLIYLDADAQREVLETFHFALRPGGLLFLGVAESLAGRTELFEPCSAAARIFRRVEGPSSTFAGVHRGGRLPAALPPRERALSLGASRPADLARGVLLDVYAPASVLVDRQHRMLHLHGPLREYLDHPAGEPTQDVTAVALPGLGARLRSALEAAAARREPVEALAPAVRRGETRVAVAISVRPVPVPHGAEPLFLVSFRDAPTGDERPSDPPPPPSGDVVTHLEQELADTRRELQGSIEDLETSNEELKAANEEILSINEELQSANEELETSKEELQSLNDELATVNRQLEQKLLELRATNDDLRNLLGSTRIATLFLDTELRLRLFTPAAAELFQVHDGDRGRQAEAVLPRVRDPSLVADARAVLTNLAPIEQEVLSPDGRNLVRRLLPYRTGDDRIAGVVVTYTDVTVQKRAQQQLERRLRQQAVVAELGRRALGGCGLQELFDEAVSRLRDVLGTEHAKVLELLPGGAELLLRAAAGFEKATVGRSRVSSGQHSQAGHTLLSRVPVLVQDLRDETRFNGPSLLFDHGVRSGMSTVIGSREAPWGVLGVHSTRTRIFSTDDVHVLEAVANVLADAIGRRRIEDELRERARMMSVLFRASTADPVDQREALRQCLAAACEITGWPVGHAWLPTSDGRALVSSGIWCCDDPERIARLRASTEQRPLRVGEGFAGGILGSGQPRVLDRLTVRGLPRLQAGGDLAREVSAAFGFPVKVGGEVVAVLEFFSHEPIRQGSLSLEAVAALAEQVERAFERSRAGVELHESAERLSLALEAGELAAWDLDLVTGAMTWSDQHALVLGHAVGEVTPSYEAWRRRVHPDDLPVVEQALQRAREQRTQFRVQYRIVQPSGEVRWVESRGRTTFDEQDRARRFHGVLLDVTERQAAEQRLREADRRKDAFLATLGHELRNPLAALSNAVAVLRSGADAGVVHQMHELMEHQVGHMTSLLNDLLDVSRISRGVVELRKRRVPVERLVASAVSTVRPEVEARGHELRCSAGPPGLAVVGDPVRLEQVLVNLLGNAARYTEPRGRITIAVEASGGEVRVAVSDTGVGLHREQLEQVFEPFYQARKGSGGLGIGLSLSRELAKLHGGRLEADSQGPGHGSTFALVLPLAPAGADGLDDERREAATAAHDVSGMHVLVVEDNEASMAVLSRLLGARCRLDTATHGAEALAKARRLHPDVVLLDVGLPDMSGIEVARVLRADPATAGARLVALTGFGDAETAAHVQDAGFDEHVLKPVDFDRLLAILQRLGDSREQ